MHNALIQRVYVWNISPPTHFDPSFIHSIDMWRMQWFLTILRSFFHSSLLCTLSFHHFPPISLPSSLTPSFHLFFGLPLCLIVSKFIYNTFMGILFSFILCTCPNQHNLFNFIVYVVVVVFRSIMDHLILEKLPASMFRVPWRWGQEVPLKHLLTCQFTWWHTRPQMVWWIIQWIYEICVWILIFSMCW